MIRKEREIKVIYALVLAIFAVFLAVPIVRLLLESFLGEAGAGISNYVEVLTGQGFLQVQIASLNGHLCHIWRPACDLNGGQPRTH